MLRTNRNWKHGLGSSFTFFMGNVSISAADLCHAKNLPELGTWFRDIIILEMEGGSSISTLEF